MNYNDAIAELKRQRAQIKCTHSITGVLNARDCRLLEAIEVVIERYETDIRVMNCLEAVKRANPDELLDAKPRTWLDAIATDSCKVTKPTKE